MTQAEILDVAARLADTACQGVTHTMSYTVDGSGKCVLGNDVKAEDLLVAEVFKIFAFYVSQIAGVPTDPNTGFPMPDVQGGSGQQLQTLVAALAPLLQPQVAAATSALTPLLASAGPAAAFAKAVLAALTSAPAAPPNLPAPGVNPSPVTAGS